MYCPNCKDEFRPGFTRCANCDVDLVDDLDAAKSSPEPVQQPRFGGPALMRDYCGYVDLADARQARDRLHAEGIRCEIAIRTSTESATGGAVEEDFFLRVDAPALPLVERILEADDERVDEEGPTMFACTCGKMVTEDAEACPQCGTRFD